MNGYAGTAAPPGGMYVRAMFDYDADDATSLSFRRGDIIQVITQLESGWWDGVINGVRGWFPSNYCQVITGPNEGAMNGDGLNGELDDGSAEDDVQDDEEEDLGYDDVDSDGNLRDDDSQPVEGSDQEQEEAAFWIPQVTPDGRLYYYNTLTGVTTMELPMENASSLPENGPRDRNNVYIPESTRRPQELIAGSYERDKDYADEYSGSEAEPRLAIDETPPVIGISPHTRSRSDFTDPYAAAVQSAMTPNGTSMTSFTGNIMNGLIAPPMPRQLFDDGYAVPLTWDRLVAEFRKAVECFRFAVDNAQRSEIVKRAENISDHLRLLLAAGSGTTDNHSGNPSIISSNKALYPLFRETMSRFSKLVLSSHIAAADYPPLDAYAKCLKEAEGMLQAVYGFVDVARQQRGEEIPRLIPGFVTGSHSGGAWRNNGLSIADTRQNLPFLEQDHYDVVAEPSARLDFRLLERLDELKLMIDMSVRRLDEQLVLQDKIITPLKHRLIGDGICKAGGKILELYRPLISTIESVNLSPIGIDVHDSRVKDYSVQKQKVYDQISELVIACQAVASPLADEWAESRADSLEDRMRVASLVLKELELCTKTLLASVKQLTVLMPMEEMLKDEVRKASMRERSMSNTSHSQTRSMYEDGLGPEGFHGGGTDKIKRIFGELPAPLMQQPAVEDVPEFLRLDHEAEITYDMKNSPPVLRGGTLTGLVEQLTRHDRLDSHFNNTFLLTYRSFTSASELLDMLVMRWGIQPPYNLSPEDYQTWVDKKQKPIQFRVVNILKSWLDNYWMEDNDDEAKRHLQRVHAFAKEHVATINTPGAAPLIATVEQRLRGQDMSKRLVLTLSKETPTPILPKNMRKLKFLDIDPTEFARQLTIIESKLYGKIKPMECLNKTWQRKLQPGEPDPAANIKALILHSNQLTNWVAQMILTQTDVKRRVIVIKHFVSVADKCRTLNNFSTLTSIISALATAPIHRLARTWNQVNGKTKDTLEVMRKLMASTKNFAEYRDAVHNAVPPCAPFLGVYLTDLTFIEDGIPSHLKKNNLINFAKRAKTAEVIRDIQSYQNVPYSLQPVTELQEYILSNMRTANDVIEMYEISLQVEPREREDEKIARLLSESGFL